MIEKVISGGQTGVDQAALDSAIRCSISYGGWLPRGRMTENGPLSDKYVMMVMVDGSYPERTRKNVEESDAKNTDITISFIFALHKLNDFSS